MTTAKPDKMVDMKGFLCPLPSLAADKTLKDMKAGQVLAVESTDPKSKTDIPLLCQEKDYAYLDCFEHGDVLIHLIKK